MRIGNLYGPDATFLGVPAADLDVATSWAGAAAVIVGAPFDGGTSHRAGCRFGPLAIRTTDYLPHDGERPHLALGVDAARRARRRRPRRRRDALGGHRAVAAAPSRRSSPCSRAASTIPIVLGGDHSITLPHVTGVARHVGLGNVGIVHFDAHADTGDTSCGLALRPRHADAAPDRARGGSRRPNFVQVGLRGYWPEKETFDWMREQGMRWHTMVEIEDRGPRP